MKNKTKTIAFTLLSIIVIVIIGLMFGSCASNYQCPTYNKHKSPIGAFNARR
jgi:hypothetical protein